jgi:hypothetical protein
LSMASRFLNEVIEHEAWFIELLAISAMGNRFHPATSAVASRDMPPTARMRASTIRSDSVSVVLPRLKNRQDHLFLGAPQQTEIYVR